MSHRFDDQSFGKEINYVNIQILQKEVIAAITQKSIYWFFNLISNQNRKIIKFESESFQNPFSWYNFLTILISNLLISWFVELCCLCIRQRWYCFFFNTKELIRMQAMGVYVSVYKKLLLSVKFRSLKAQKLNFRIQVVLLLIFNLW